jgi:16S rRNA (cytosine967-C5)-methyltransferase
MPVDIVRDSAIDVLLRIEEKKVPIQDAIDRTLTRKAGRLSERGTRFLTQLVYGTTRHRLLCEYVLRPLLRQPIDKLPLPIRIILRMGVYQNIFLHTVTIPAMVHTSVDLAKKRGHIGTSRLTNAVLKRVPDTLDAITFPDREENLHGYLSIRYSMPGWIVHDWLNSYGPETTESICQASEKEAPLCIRLNTLRADQDTLEKRMAKHNIQLAPVENIPDAFVCLDQKPSPKLKAFQEGLFYFQDPASMLPSLLVDPKPEETVLDMCAAPGGKSTHMAQLMEDRGLIISNDRAIGRCYRILDNKDRLGTESVHITVSDGISSAFQPERFDRVLVDAPCTGLGTLRRNPDIKFRLHSNALKELNTLQQDLLRSGMSLCKNNGVLVYSVCTFTEDETMDVIQPLLDRNEAVLEDGPECLNTWKIAQGIYRILPGNSLFDGFFLARLRKTS